MPLTKWKFLFKETKRRAYIRELKKVLEERERKETIKRLLHKKALTKKKLEVKILSPSSS